MNGFRRTAQSDPFNIEVPDNHFTSAVSEYAGWGYFDFRRRGEGFAEGFQSMPANWAISSPRKRCVFQLLAEITGADVGSAR